VLTEPNRTALVGTDAAADWLEGAMLDGVAHLVGPCPSKLKLPSA
jgi:hypothetical protein